MIYIFWARSSEVEHPADNGKVVGSIPAVPTMSQYFTQKGLEDIKKELHRLKTVEIKKVADLIKHAASFGDLKENFAYHDAKDKQAFLQGKILELEDKIRNAQIIEKKQNGKIEIGSIALVLLNGDKEEIEIVGSDQSDPIKNKISYQSPLGKNLLNKAVGDKVKVDIEGNKINCEILEIK